MNISRLLMSALLTVLTATTAEAQMSVYDYNKPLGWATVDGSVTGGNEENAVLVTTLSEFKSAFSGTAKKTIYVQGEIVFTGSVSFKSVKNKTVYGLPGSAFVNTTHSTKSSESGIMTLSSCENIIMRNMTFKGAGAYDIDGNDNLSINGCKYIWIDHCDFQDGVDGNMDCGSGSDNICISWCRFHYFIAPWAGGSGGSNDHRYTNLWGSSDSSASKDEGHLKTTFYGCWWDEGCKERMPRIRFGKVHLLNCLYSSSISNYCVGAGYKSNAYVERCVFINQRKPWKKYATSSNYKEYNITMTGNIGASDEQSRYGTIDYFVPADYYTLEGFDATLVETEVKEYAGATLPVEYGKGVTTGIASAVVGDAEIESVTYYSPSGMRLSAPQKGINIVRRKMSDGTVQTVKTLVR